MENTGRFLLAIVLMIAVIIGTNLLFPPVPPEPAPPAVAEDVRPPEPAEPPAPIELGDPPAPAPDAGPPVAQEPAPADDPAAAVRLVTVESPIYRYGLSTGGGALASAELLRYESFTRPGPVELVPQGVGDLVGHRIEIAGDTVDLRRVPFEVDAEHVVVTEVTGPRTVSMEGRDPRTGTVVELAYTFRPNQYLVGVEGRVRTPGAAVPTLLVDLGPTLRFNEMSATDDERALAYVVNARREGIRSVRLDNVREPRTEDGPLVWAGIKNKYFLAAGLSRGEELGRVFAGVVARPAPLEHAADLTATLPLTRDGGFAYDLYIGPQQYEHLTAAGRNLGDVNPYGWRVFRPVIQPLAHVVTWAMLGMHRILDVGYGWILILFGVLIRVVMWPLNARAMRAQLKNMAAQPKLQEIQKKYKDDPQRLQKEMLRLYKEEGFNPLAGCLPMLIPFPVLITLFFVFQGTIEFRGVEFLWLPDLSRPDPYYILPVLLGASMFLIQWLGLRAMPTPNPQMKMLLWIMPIFMLIIFANLASGLNLYYAAFNVATLPQQLQLSRERRRAQLRLATAEAAK